MNVFSLMRGLRQHLENEFVNLPLVSRLRDSAESHLRKPAVYIGQLPAKSAQAAYEAPFVLLQPMNGADTIDGWAEVELALRFVIFNDETEGAENDLHNFVAFCRHALMRFRQLPLDEKFVLQEKEGMFLPWTRPDDQAPPFLEAYVISNWKFQGWE